MDKTTGQRDDSGRSRLAPNLFASWIAHGVTIVVGFIMPRMIYESVGQTVLGFWDLGWSLIVYIAYSGLGFAPAITYQIARLRAEGNDAAAREVIATAWYCQLLVALLAAAAFLGLFTVVFVNLPPDPGITAKPVILMAVLLSLTILVGLAGDVAQGVLSGCHRASANEYIAISSDVLLALAMIGVLVFGGELVWLAAVTFGSRLLMEVTRLIYAKRICGELTLSLRYWRTGLVYGLFRYSVKTTTTAAQDLLVHQLARLLLAVAAGPAALAAFSRYMTLVRQISRIGERMAVVIRPMTSGLVGLGRGSEVARLYQRAANATVLLVLPIVIVLGVFGDVVVEIWMGPEFVVPGLAWILAVMALFNADRAVTVQVLAGLNSHGRIAMICLLSSLGIFALLLLGLFLLGLGTLDPFRAGLLVALSMIAGVSVPNLTMSCRRVGIPLMEHVRKVWLKPLITNTMFLFFMLWSSQELQRGAYAIAALSMVAGGLLLTLAYWTFTFDDWLRERLRERLARILNASFFS